MKTRTKAILDWTLLIVFCVFLFSTRRILPTIWYLSSFLLEEDVVYIPMLFIGSIMFFLLFYTVFFKEHRRLSCYVSYIVLSSILSYAYYHIREPYDRMHLFEYFVLSFLFFRAFQYHIYNQKIYFLGAIFTILIAAMDETTQIFVENRTFSLADIGADFTAAVLGQFSIATIIKPKIQRWRFTLKLKRRHLAEEKRWLSRRKLYSG